MKISEVKGYSLSSPYGDGKVLGQPLGVKSIGIVEIHTDNNIVGIGETYSGVYAPELIDPIATSLGHSIIGHDPMEIENMIDILNLPFIGNSGIMRSVISGFDIALWDIKGQVLDKPIYKILNGDFRERVQVYASGGSASFSESDIFLDVQNILSKGFDAYKMRIGYQSWDNDLRRVRVARETLGEDRLLMVDAIMGTLRNPWTPEAALEKIKDLDRFFPYWIEEPLHPSDLQGYQYLKDNLEIKIALGESFSGEHEFAAYITLNAADIIQPDVTHCGGFMQGIKIIKLAETKGIPIALHVWGSAISIMANLHLACAMCNVKWLEIPQVKLELLSDKLLQLINVHKGLIGTPQTAGLGITLDEAVKLKYKFIPGSGYRIP